MPVDSLMSSKQPEQEVKRPPLQIVWRNVVLMATLHISAIYGIYILPQAKLYTLVWSKNEKSNNYILNVLTISLRLIN
jgi:hypothetical protein